MTVGSNVPHRLRDALASCIITILVTLACGACGASTPASAGPDLLVVNSTDDIDRPPDGTVTIRSALREIAPGGVIRFSPALDGATIGLVLVGNADTVLKGEVFVMNGGKWEFQGYQNRRYGASALHAAKTVSIDASDLPSGITLAWTGGDADPARVIAIAGDLTMRHVTVTGGRSVGVPTGDPAQPSTLARGGGLAVWGTATLENCTIGGNAVRGDVAPSRDRGAFGGGIYADRVKLDGCVVSGNSARGFGAAGGGVYSVGGGGDDRVEGSAVTCSAVTGNRVTAQHAYGGGVYSDGGGPGNLKSLFLENCTIARNLVEDDPDIVESSRMQYYARGGGIYFSNGAVSVASCTIAENVVNGMPALFNGKPNTGGGGIAATIGNAHVVDSLRLRHSIIAGNAVNAAPQDVYTGSLMHLYSDGYNLVGTLDVSQMLVPAPPFMSISRRHWPKTGDREDVALADALDVAAAGRHRTALSAGTDSGSPSVVWYPPAAAAIDRIPPAVYLVTSTVAQYDVKPGGTDDFLVRVLARLRADLGPGFAPALDPAGVTWHGPQVEWPSNADNADWIGFWRAVDTEVGGRFGAAGLGDGFWSGFAADPPGGDIVMTVKTVSKLVRLTDIDQRGTRRPAGGAGDTGAVEH